MRLKGVHFGNDIVEVGHQQALGELQLQTIRVGARACQHRQHLIHKIGLIELPGAHVDRNRELGQRRFPAPPGQLGASGLKYPVAQRQDEPGFLRQRNEFGG